MTGLVITDAISGIESVIPLENVIPAGMPGTSTRDGNKRQGWL